MVSLRFWKQKRNINNNNNNNDENIINTNFGNIDIDKLINPDDSYMNIYQYGRNKSDLHARALNKMQSALLLAANSK